MERSRNYQEIGPAANTLVANGLPQTAGAKLLHASITHHHVSLLLVDFFRPGQRRIRGHREHSRAQRYTVAGQVPIPCQETVRIRFRRREADKVAQILEGSNG